MDTKSKVAAGVTKATSDESLFADWIVDIDARVANINTVSEEELLCRKAYIYKVPTYIRELSPGDFTPKLVSLGPFHYDNSELKKMKVHKERALVQFLKRANQSLENLKQEVAKIKDELRDAYYPLDDRWKRNNEEFLKMMILDGCFIHEILLMLKYPFDSGTRGYSVADPYFSFYGFLPKMSYVKRDMILMENQLPLLLLKTLLHFYDPNLEDDYINMLVNKVLERSNIATTGLGLHALDLYRQSLLSPKIQSGLQQQYEPPDGFYIGHQETMEFDRVVQTIPCATKLHEAGVSFKRSETDNHMDIKFDSRTGKFHLPFLFVDDDTKCFLRNVTIFEQLHVYTSPVVSAYVKVMDEIINSANDVRLLHEKRLILNTLGSDEETACMFNSISKQITWYTKDANRVRTEVSKYCRRRRNRWRAYLIHTYFQNPWTAISLAGALLVIALTIAQTVLAAVK